MRRMMLWKVKAISQIYSVNGIIARQRWVLQPDLILNENPVQISTLHIEYT